MGNSMSVTYVAAAAAVLWVVYRVQLAHKAEVEHHTEDVRQPVYRNAAAMMDAGPTIVKRVYKEGPLSWIGEDQGGTKWIAYSTSDQVPAVFSRSLAMRAE